VNLVDSCGWLEYLANGVNADFFSPPLIDTDTLVVPSICILEVMKKIHQERGENAASDVFSLMNQGIVVSLDADTAIQSAKLSFELKLPLADSVVLATARMHNAILWTQDSHFKDLVGVRYIEKQP
jgi:toxin FitB